MAALIAIGIFLWSLATASCAFARSFMQVLLARIAVGVGEATLVRFPRAVARGRNEGPDQEAPGRAADAWTRRQASRG